MSITLLMLASPLRGKLDNRSEVELPHVEGETAREFLERLFRAYRALRSEMLDGGGRLHYEYQVWQNEEMVRDESLDRPVKDGDTLGLLLPIAGGDGAQRAGRRPPGGGDGPLPGRRPSEGPKARGVAASWHGRVRRRTPTWEIEA